MGDRDGRFGSRVGHIGPEWDKSGNFLDQISVHLARASRVFLVETPSTSITPDARSRQPESAICAQNLIPDSVYYVLDTSKKSYSSDTLRLDNLRPPSPVG